VTSTVDVDRRFRVYAEVAYDVETIEESIMEIPLH
jgi:hypothetical protein